MDNVTTKITGKTLTITVDLSKRYGRSESGKTEIVASTRGALKLAQPFLGTSVALNVYTKPQA